MKILIIEDEALLAEGLRTLLELRGFEVETVSDGENGAEYAESGSYDLLTYGNTSLDPRAIPSAQRARCGSPPGSST